MKKLDAAVRTAKLRSAVAMLPDLARHFARSALGAAGPSGLYYVVPARNWITDWVGGYVTEGISRQFPLRARVTATPHLLSGQLLHYGEVGAYLATIGSRRNRANQLIVTYFHGSRDPAMPDLAAAADRFLQNAAPVRRVLTSNRIMEGRLLEWGIPAEKLVTIPLGVDLELFRPGTPSERRTAKAKLGIPEDSFCIGSFQKDGVGFGNGLEPKLVKGPDLFLKVVEQLHKQVGNLFVLLTAPARGYVMKGLEHLGVRYRHDNLDSYSALAFHYHCLDLYLVASREEGGPSAMLEALASGVPLVSTRCGMAPELIEHGRSGLLSQVGDYMALAEHAATIIEDAELAGRLVQGGLETIKGYGWPQIAQRYYWELYHPLLK